MLFSYYSFRLDTFPIFNCMRGAPITLNSSMLIPRCRRQFSCSAVCPRLKHQLKKLVQEPEDTQERARYADGSRSSSKLHLPAPVQFQVNDVVKDRIRDFFNQDLSLVLKSKPSFNVRHGLVYKHLNTSRDRLTNSYLASSDAKKRLAANDVPGAVFVARLAGGVNGSVAMNLILKYLVDQDQINRALDVYRVLKKWGVVENQYTFSILFNKKSADATKHGKNAIARKPGVSTAYVLDRIRALESSGELTTVSSNAALAGMTNCHDAGSHVHDIVEFYESIPHKDNYTYSCMLTFLGGLRRNNTDNSIAVIADDSVASSLDLDDLIESIWKSAIRGRKNKIDHAVARSYIYARVSRASNGGDNSILTEFAKLFDFTHFGPVGVKLSKAPRSVKPESHFVPQVAELDLLVRLLRSQKQYTEALDIVEYFMNNDASETSSNANGNITPKISPRTWDRSLALNCSICLRDSGQVDRVTRIYQNLFQQSILSSDIVANMIRTYLHAAESKDIDFELIDTMIDRVVGGSRGKRKSANKALYDPLLKAYVEVYLHVYRKFSQSLSGQFDRSYGLRALRRSLFSCQYASDNADTLTKILQLLNAVRARKAWAYTQLVWMGRAKEGIIEYLSSGDKKKFAKDMKTAVELLER